MGACDSSREAFIALRLMTILADDLNLTPQASRSLAIWMRSCRLRPNWSSLHRTKRADGGGGCNAPLNFPNPLFLTALSSRGNAYQKNRVTPHGYAEANLGHIL